MHFVILDLTSSTPEVIVLDDDGHQSDYADDIVHHVAMDYLLSDPREVYPEPVITGQTTDLVVYRIEGDDLVLADKYHLRVAC
jgi:hypothetical protein